MDLSHPQNKHASMGAGAISAMSAKPPPHVVVTGNALRRGRQYGRFAAARIAHSVESYKMMFATCDINWTQAQQMALPYVEVIERTFPELLEELQGVSEGSGVDFASLMALNCRTELLPPDFLARASGLPPAQLPDGGQINECTSLSFARAGKPVWLAQNWDWVGAQREALILVESHPDKGPAHITVTEAGMLAKIGFNETGLGITLNILRSHQDGQSPGMPVHMLLRGLLDCTDVNAALDLAMSLQYASSSNVMIADPTGNIASIEASPSGVRSLPSKGDQLCHTNHFLHPDLTANDASVKGNLSTGARLDTAHAQIDNIEDFSGVRTLLSDTSAGLQSVCRFPDEDLPAAARVETVLAVAMNLTDRELWVTGEQPSVSEFQKFTLA